MRKIIGSFFLLLLVTSLPALADASGSWAGIYSVSIPCQSGGTIDSSGSAAAVLSQSGNDISGSLTLQNFNVPDRSTCTGTPQSSVSAPLQGTLTGTSFSGTLSVPSGAVAVVGTITDTTMSLSVSDDRNGSTGSVTLGRSTTLPPAVNVGGTWSGQYQEAALCGNNPLVASGTMTVTLVQNGRALTGSVTYDQQIVNCTKVSPAPNVTDSLTGFVSNNVFSATVIDAQLGTAVGAGVINGNQMTFVINASTTGTAAIVGMLTQTAAGPPVVASFAATPAIIGAGQSSTLSWSTLGASAVTIDNGVGAQPASGSFTVSPAATTTYTLTAAGATGTATATTTVTVGNGTTPPAVNVGQLPSGMLEPSGIAGATDRYTLVNSGGAPAAITLSQNGSFFTQSPASFTIPAGGSQTVLITASAQPIGAYDGASLATGSGTGAGLSIPIHLVVAAPPSGTVAPVVVGTVRLETSGVAGQNQATGSVPFKNSGNDTLQGIAASDVPWLIPQGGIITIAPGATQPIGYTVDRTKRPDAASPLGGQTGTLSLKFLRGVSGKGVSALDATSTTSSVSVTLVDVVKPGVAPGTPQPLSPGEIAFFVPGISSLSSATGDLLLANRGGAAVSDLKLFYGSAGGSASQVTSLGSLAANAGIAFPAVVRTVFGIGSQVGALQLRSSQLANVSVATVQVNTSQAATYATALPVLRSDRGAAANGALYLVGVAKNDHQKTNLELQEMSGVAATATTDFLDANGNVVSSRSDSLPAFGFFDLPDVAPAGAVMARVRNGASGVIGAYATVVDSLTNDATVVTDLATPSADTFFAPVVPGGNAAGTSSVAFTNALSSTITVNASIMTTAAHHHSASRGTPAFGNGGPQTTFNVAPLGVFTIPATNYGFIKLTAPAGALHGSAKFSIPVGATPDTFGSGVPLFSSSAAIGSGSAKRFAGVEDSSAATVARGTSATYRSNLTLIETTNQPATVQVTLRFNFVSGALTATQVTTSKNFDVPAGSFLLLTDLGRAIIGTQRDAIGDLHNIQVDVSVAGGNGKVIPVLESIDNSTGDVTVRSE